MPWEYSTRRSRKLYTINSRSTKNITIARRNGTNYHCAQNPDDPLCETARIPDAKDGGSSDSGGGGGEDDDAEDSSSDGGNNNSPDKG